MGFGRRACSTPHNRGLHISPVMLRSTLIDEVGYLSYSNRHADLLFELINRRHEKKSTLITRVRRQIGFLPRSPKFS